MKPGPTVEPRHLITSLLRLPMNERWGNPAKSLGLNWNRPDLVTTQVHDAHICKLSQNVLKIQCTLSLVI